MSVTQIKCYCGAVELSLDGAPTMQYVCHCDDCQAVHGEAFAVALYPATAVVHVGGDTGIVTLRATPRTKCNRCGTYLFAIVPGQPFCGVNGGLLPPGQFTPKFHVQCRYASAPIVDGLPHYKNLPLEFRGSGELMNWEL